MWEGSTDAAQARTEGLVSMAVVPLKTWDIVLGMDYLVPAGTHRNHPNFGTWKVRRNRIETLYASGTPDVEQKYGGGGTSGLQQSAGYASDRADEKTSDSECTAALQQLAEYESSSDQGPPEKPWLVGRNKTPVYRPVLQSAHVGVSAPCAYDNGYGDRNDGPGMDTTVKQRRHGMVDMRGYFFTDSQDPMIESINAWKNEKWIVVDRRQRRFLRQQGVHLRATDKSNVRNDFASMEMSANSECHAGETDYETMRN